MRGRENFRRFGVVLLVIAAGVLVLGFETAGILAALGALLAISLGQLTDTGEESSKRQESSERQESVTRQETATESNAGQSDIERIKEQYAAGEIDEGELERRIEGTLEPNNRTESERSRERLLE